MSRRTTASAASSLPPPSSSYGARVSAYARRALVHHHCSTSAAQVTHHRQEQHSEDGNGSIASTSTQAEISTVHENSTTVEICSRREHQHQTRSATAKAVYIQHTARKISNEITRDPEAGVSRSNRANLSSQIEEDLGDFKYPTNLQFKGVTLIFNYYKFAPELKLKERLASKHDAKELQEVFSLYGFQVFVYNNLSADKLKSTLGEFARSQHVNLEHFESFVLIMLTHGVDAEFLYAYDAPIPFGLLHELFVESNCPALAGKPKVYIIQACRGSEADEGVLLGYDDESDSTAFNMSSVNGLPHEPDFLFAFSTPAGYLSFKNTERGSYFIYYLCTSMMDLYRHRTELTAKLQCIEAGAVEEHANEAAEIRHNLDKLSARFDVVWLLRAVARQISFMFQSNCAEPELHGKKQVPCIVSTLQGNFFLLTR